MATPGHAPVSDQDARLVRGLVIHEDDDVIVLDKPPGLAVQGGIVLVLTRMNRILEIDYNDRLAVVQPGVTNIAITNAVAGQGFFYAPDPSSQLACTIAGNIAMNSGGAHCLRYGVTTNNILAVRMVLIDGTIIDIGSDAMDAAGLDLLGLVIGSEGQLGVGERQEHLVVDLVHQRTMEMVEAALLRQVFRLAMGEVPLAPRV